jgi:mannitol-1-phosphate/altronate dehydrogenase
MTRDDIIRMARKAAEETGTLVPTEWNDPLLERFAALVAAAEREACAEVCEMRKILEVDYEDERHYNQGIEHSAAAIRARGEA